MRGTEWEDAFVAMSWVLGESEEAVTRALGHPLTWPAAKDARAKIVAAHLATIAREIDAAGRPPWRE